MFWWWRHQKSVLFVMTSSKIGPFCDDVITKRGPFSCVFVMTSSKKKRRKTLSFLLMTSSQYIYVGLRPYIGKIFGPKKHQLWPRFSRFPFKILKWEFYRLIGFSMYFRMTCRMTSYDVIWKNRFSRFSRDIGIRG